MKFSELELPGNFETEQDPFSFIGEPDGNGNIIFVRHYRNDPDWKRKSKPLTISAAKFWGTAKAVKDGTYVPKKIKNSRLGQLSSVPIKCSKDKKKK
jgi:hypothetical protein